MDLAYIRDGAVTHTDESVILALLFHTRGRKSKDHVEEDLKTVRRIMKDKNLNN